MSDNPIEPDSKDWTWVLERRCDDCGFDPATVTRGNLVERISRAADPWPARLRLEDARRRPAPAVWSPTEYAAHVRDVAGVMAGRLEVILTHEDGEFPDWDQDAAALAADYASQDPGEVSAELRPAVETLAAAFAAVGGEQWDRSGRRSNGSVFTAYTLGVYALHDFEHHLHDVGGAPPAPASPAAPSP